MTCRDCGHSAGTTHTQELSPEVIRRYHKCEGCGRKSVSLQLEMGRIDRVPADVVVAILNGKEPPEMLQTYHKPPLGD